MLQKTGKMDALMVSRARFSNAGRTFVIRNRSHGPAGKARQAAGVAVGPMVWFRG